MSEPEQPLIRNCRFAFRCHQSWRGLERTTDPRQRYCHECAREVVLCRNDEELRHALQANACVAIRQQHAGEALHTIGFALPESSWNGNDG